MTLLPAADERLRELRGGAVGKSEEEEGDVARRQRGRVRGDEDQAPVLPAHRGDHLRERLPGVRAGSDGGQLHLGVSKEQLDERLARIARRAYNADLHGNRRIRLVGCNIQHKQKGRRPGSGGGLGKGQRADQRFENWNRLRAPGWPAFLRSFSRGSRLMWPAFLRAGRSSAFIFCRARAMPWATAPAWPATPPPMTFAVTSIFSRRFDGQEGGVGLLGEILVREVALEGAAVDEQLAAAVGDADAGRGRLAAAGAGENVRRVSLMVRRRS